MRDIARLWKRVLAWVLTLCALCALLPAPSARASAVAAPANASGALNGMVRVSLSSLGSPSQIDVTVSGSYSLDGTAATSIPSGTRVSVVFSASTGRLLLVKNGVSTDMGTGFTLRRHVSAGESGLRIAQARDSANLYPGDLEFKVKSSAGSFRLYTIAHVFIEDYLCGVVPYEMGMSSPLEALKAQCVSARTYTLRAMQAAQSSDYDVVDTTADQVYRGTPAGAAVCKQAVAETQGLIAMNGAAFTATFYTASNGGQIESVRNIWGSEGYGYISVRDDPYDYGNSASQVRSFTVNRAGAPSNSALRSLLESRAKTVFGAGSVTITGVSAVTPHTPRYAAPSRLYTKLDFTVTALADGVSRTGTLSFDIFGELESALGMSINSDNNELWTVVSTASGFTVQSRRFGHGTGLSQRGAMRMADLGYAYDDILAFYFPGCRRVGYSFLSSVLSALSAAASSEQLTVVAPADLSSAAACTGVVTLSAADATLPLRVSASLTGDTLCALPQGAVVRVRALTGDWCLVTYGALCGYVQKSALALAGTPDGAALSPTTLAAYGTVNNSTYLNLRQSASEAAAVLAQIPSGAAIPLISVDNGWAYTQYGPAAGYVNMSYVTRRDTFPGTAEDPDAAGAEVVAEGGAPLRLTASTTGHVSINLPKGALVKVKYDDGSWTLCYYAGMTGYILSSALRRNSVTIDETPDAPGAGEQYAVVVSNASTLNMRAEGSLSAAILAEIPKGETVIVMQAGQTWCKVRYHGVEGFCMTQYLQLTGSVPGDSETLTAIVTTEKGSLNLRKSQSANSTRITQIPRLATVLVTQRGAEWCAVTYNQYSGYVMTRYLTFGASPTQTPQAPAATATPAPGATSDPLVPVAARVTTVQGSLNLREKPQSGANIIDRIPQNEVVTVLSVSGTWTSVSYRGNTGYVMSVFLTYIYTAVTQTQTPAPAATQTPAPGTVTAEYARVTTVQGSLNLREKPRTGANILTTIPQNTLIRVLEKLGTWTRVEYNGTEGYVMTTFLTFVTAVGTATPAPANPGTPLQARVTTVKGSLNLRSEARSGAKILTTIPQNTVITVYENLGTWCRVAYDGETGYVMTAFLTFIGAASMQQPQSPTGAPATGEDEKWARVTTQEGTLNLREKARSGAKVLTTIPQFAVISVLSKGAVWTNVAYNGETGYVKTEFLTFLSATPTPVPGGALVTQTPAPQQSTGADAQRDPTLAALSSLEIAQVLPTGGSANILAGCDASASVVANVLRGDYVVITARGSAWCAVAYEGKSGFLPTGILQ